MEKHDNVVKDLNAEFNKVDRAYQAGEMRIFGQNAGKILKELDVIRRKQIDLATDHVSLEVMNDIPLKQTAAVTNNNNAKPNNTTEASTFSAKSFEKKQLALKQLMEKLSDLTEALEQFERISKVDYEGSETLITSEAKEDDSTTAAAAAVEDQEAMHQQKDLLLDLAG